jgi:hypothetical protein
MPRYQRATGLLSSACSASRDRWPAVGRSDMISEASTIQTIANSSRNMNTATGRRSSGDAEGTSDAPTAPQTKPSMLAMSRITTQAEPSQTLAAGVSMSRP